MLSFSKEKSSSPAPPPPPQHTVGTLSNALVSFSPDLPVIYAHILVLGSPRDSQILEDRGPVKRLIALCLRVEITQEIHKELTVLKSLFVPFRSNKEQEENATTFSGRFYTNCTQHGSVSGVILCAGALCCSFCLYQKGKRRKQDGRDHFKTR